jgi:5-methylcytosine-specific restriction endonuclease McrA
VKRSPLRRKKALRNASGLARQSSLRRRLPPPKGVEARRVAKQFYDAVARPGGRPATCAVCGAKGRMDAHHVISQQALKRRAAESGLDPLLLTGDPANGMPLCRRCHEKHTNAVESIPRHLVPRSAWTFAASLGLTWWIERFYPDEPTP